jgi:exonuclease VII large subunit
MNIENKVFGKLFQEEKVELSSQEIQLASVPDGIKKLINKFESETRTIGSSLSSEISSKRKQYNQVKKAMMSALKEGKLAEKDKEVKDEIQRVENFYSNYTNAKDSYFDQLVKNADSLSK